MAGGDEEEEMEGKTAKVLQWHKGGAVLQTNTSRHPSTVAGGESTVQGVRNEEEKKKEDQKRSVIEDRRE